MSTRWIPRMLLVGAVLVVAAVARAAEPPEADLFVSADDRQLTAARKAGLTAKAV